MTSMTHSVPLCGCDVKCQVFAVPSSETQRDDFYRAELKSAIKKSTWSLSLVLKASAMTRVASRCSIPLSDTPFTSRITWPTRNCPQICTEPPFWKTERERKRERNKQRKSQTLRKRENIYQKCERKDKWEMGEKMSACSLRYGTLYWEVISWPPVSHSIKIKCPRTGRKRWAFWLSSFVQLEGDWSNSPATFGPTISSPQSGIIMVTPWKRCYSHIILLGSDLIEFFFIYFFTFISITITQHDTWVWLKIE